MKKFSPLLTIFLVLFILYIPFADNYADINEGNTEQYEDFTGVNEIPESVRAKTDSYQPSSKNSDRGVTSENDKVISNVKDSCVFYYR